MANDTTIPQLSIPSEGIQIDVVVQNTQSLINDQGYTYDQSGFTYNQANVDYGGRYNYDLTPLTLTSSDPYTVINTGGKLLQENSFHILLENGAFILL